MGNKEPCDLCGGRAFVIFGQTAASSKPGEGSLDDPSAGEKLEPFDALRSFDNLNRPRTAMRDRVHELVAPIDPVGKNMAHTG